MSFYDEISRYKKSYRLTNNDLGAVIGKSESAFRQALNRESLSSLEMDRIREYLEKYDQSGVKPVRGIHVDTSQLCTDGAPDLKKVARFVFAEIDNLMNEPEFQAIAYKWKYEALLEDRRNKGLD